MNINKADAKTEMEMDMTPMIDVVFLLIIFFMIITDLTQQDLEVLKLPVAHAATPDKPDPKLVRPVVNILDTGKMIVKQETKYDPENPDLAVMEAYLSDQARLMDRAHFNKEAGTGPLIPDNPLLIRADRNAPFKYVQKVMELCGKKGIEIWKLELAAAEPKEDEPEQ
ncbi:MAG: biopolymer transporter ExbD [Planctomycetota bacterium]